MQTNRFRARSKSRTASISQICRKGDPNVCLPSAADPLQHRRLLPHVFHRPFFFFDTIHTFPDLNQQKKQPYTWYWKRIHRLYLAYGHHMNQFAPYFIVWAERTKKQQPKKHKDKFSPSPDVFSNESAWESAQDGRTEDGTRQTQTVQRSWNINGGL